MIDIESKVFSSIATALRAQFSGIYVYGEYVKSPSSFPCVSFVEMDNYPVVQTQDSTNLENHANVLYEVNIYSNKKSGKKTECRTIAAFVDSEMQKLGFTRLMLNPIPNVDDATIYRMVGRYKAVVSKNEEIYRR